jgi:hypothetical protein
LEVNKKRKGVKNMPDEEATTDAPAPADWKKLLADLLKGEGLEVLEDNVVTTVRGVFKALPAIAKIIPGTLDDMAVQIIVALEPKILEMCDKIDGKDDPNY